MFKERQFKSYRDLLYNKTGISISPLKKEMFHMKIQKLMLRNSIESYDDYFKIIADNRNIRQIEDFINTITTNTTEFFRENTHFEYIEKNIQNIFDSIPRIAHNREIRVWCAASSSGQEAATIVMVLKECIDPKIRIKLLATDISSKVLKKAMKGLYTESECDGIPNRYMNKYFSKVEGGYQLNKCILNSISYRYFNLMQEFKFKKLFDIVFCRNVMIYFDNKAQETLINKFYDIIVKEGLLFIGHSESLINKRHLYKFMEAAVYKKDCK